MAVVLIPARPAVVVAVAAFVAIVAARPTKWAFGPLAVFLGTALVGVAASAAGLDRCQPRCDLGHRDG